MLESILIRKATEKDLDKICKSHLRSIKEIGIKSVPSNQDLTKYVLENMNAFYVAESDENIVGQALVVPSQFIQYVSHDDRIVSKFSNFLSNIYVPPEHRKNQIGSEIIGEIEKDTNFSNTPAVYSCGGSESGKIFLEKNGYINIGKECRCCEIRTKKCEKVPMYIKHIK